MSEVSERDAKLIAEMKTWRVLFVAAAIVLTVLIVSHNVRCAIRDSEAIKAGLHQSEPAVGGYWVKGDAK